MSDTKEILLQLDNPLRFRLGRIKEIFLLLKSLTQKRPAGQSVSISQHLTMQTRLCLLYQV